MTHKTRGKRILSAGGLASLSLAIVGGGGVAHASPASPPSQLKPAHTYTVDTILSGMSLSHSYIPAGATSPSREPLTKPDDITRLGNHIFVGFQNGVGPQGEPSSDGNLDSTIVEMKMNGDPVGQWDIAGKADGVTADPETGLIIATVNEDGNSSVYTIDPKAGFPLHRVKHYQYNEALPHNGGTDAISVYHGKVLISASAPGTSGAPAPQAAYPAVYSIRFDRKTLVAKATPLFNDEDPATVANLQDPRFGKSVTLALTDPDSNEVVPKGARFGGDFMLTSQGDQEQIYVRGAGGPHQRLQVLSLSQSVDDTAWPTADRGLLYATDSTNDTVDTVSGRFVPGRPLVVATPCGSNSAPATCPAPPTFPANYLATLDPGTGVVTQVTTVGASFTPQGGLLFVPQSHRQRERD
jgi:hypothetical protein